MGDVDGDGKTKSLERELRSLEGLTFEVTVVEEPVDASPKTEGHDGGDAVSPAVPAPGATLPAPTVTPSSASSKDKPQEPAPLVITLDVDGLVTSINGVDYLPA